jgi:hypothetical protein
MQRPLMARCARAHDHLAMEKPLSPHAFRRPAEFLERIRRWVDRLGARHGQRVMVALAIGMAVVLLLSYVEVLQDQMARASSAEHVARAGTVTPAKVAGGAGTDGARAVRNHMR